MVKVTLENADAIFKANKEMVDSKKKLLEVINYYYCLADMTDVRTPLLQRLANVIYGESYRN